MYIDITNENYIIQQLEDELERVKTMQDKFDEIYDSLRNGQRRQMVAQMNELGMYEFPDLINYIAVELNQPEEALDLVKSYFRITAKKG